MPAVRPLLVFLSGFATYSMVAACSGAGGTAAVSSGGGGAGHGGSSGRTSGGAENPGAGGFATTTSNGGSGATGTGGFSSSSNGGGAAAGGSGGTDGTGGSNALRLFREFGAGPDGSRDLSFTLVPAWLPHSMAYHYMRPERLLWDNARQEECAFRPASDARARCLPTDVADASVVFTDAACTERAVGVAAPLPGCAITVARYAFTTDPPSSSCNEGVGRYHVFPVGAFVGSDIPCYRTSGGSCVLTSCTDGGGDSAVYAVGNEIPASKFVAGATVTHD